ncbi:MAG: hypothetical protein M1368_06290, partial [Thaumarchaeota archaeon]|nr:hypothetical protein [Nitrososphaerota archaeon]
IIEGRILVNLLERIGVTWAPSIFVLYSDLIKVGLYDESLHIGEDYDLILKLARFRPFYAVKKPVYGHRIVASGLWNSTAKESSYATNLSIMERHIAANKIKTNFMIRDQIACCLIISRDFNKALVYTLRDPRYLGSFMRWARITYDRKFRHARIEDLGS